MTLSAPPPPTTPRGFLFWSLPALGAILFIWLFQSVLLPFAIGLAIAYLLNPLVNRLGKEGVRRSRAALLLLLLFLAASAFVLLLTIPALLREADALVRLAPLLWEKAQEFVNTHAGLISDPAAEGTMGPDLPSLLKNNAASAAGVGKSLAHGLAVGGAFLISLMTVLVVAPITAFFMIKEWPLMTRWARSLIPPDIRPTVLDLCARMDRKIAGFVRGQLLVAGFLGGGYAFVLFVMGLDYSVLIGLTAGVLNLVPLLGSSCGLLIGVIVAWLQTGDWQFTGMIALVFVAGQLIEGNFLTPRVVGSSVGMHPLWVFFSVLAGASIAGIAGMLLAVPMAACIGVLLEYAIARYKDSPRYKVPETPAAKKPKKRAL
jgi:predicted PurR-regulated permease PerM